MRRVKLELCYDGAQYAGWQIQKKQPNVKTIQEELQKAIARVVGEEVEVLGSGRTDAGVHALYQVAAFSTESHLPADALTRAINAFLPRDVRIWRASDVALDFHPIRDVVRKRYRYLASDSRPVFPFFRRNAWTLLQKVDLDAMRAAAFYLLGTFDFSAFQTQGSPRKTTVRTVFDVRVERLSLADVWTFPELSRQKTRPNGASTRTGTISEIDIDATSAASEKTTLSPFVEPSLVAFEIEADGFLYNMVRSIVGTLCHFGTRHKGFENPATMQTIVASADRRLAGPTAPPWGLYMIDVIYPGDKTKKE